MKMTSSVVIALLSATVCFFTGCGESAPEPVTKASALIAGTYCHGELVLSEERARVYDSLMSYLDMCGRQVGYDYERKCLLLIQTAATVSPASSAQELKVETLMAALGEFAETISSEMTSSVAKERTGETITETRGDGMTTKTEIITSTSKETFGEITISATQKLTTVTTEQKSDKDSEVMHFEAKWCLLLGETEILTVSSTDVGPSITFDKKVFSDKLTAEAVMTLMSKNGVQVKPLYEALAIQNLTFLMRLKAESVKDEVNGTQLSHFFFPSLRGEGGPCIEYGAVYLIKSDKLLERKD